MTNGIGTDEDLAHQEDIATLSSEFPRHYKRVAKRLDRDIRTRQDFAESGKESPMQMAILMEQFGIQDISYAHYKDTIKLVDNWLRTGLVDQDLKARVRSAAVIERKKLDPLIDHYFNMDPEDEPAVPATLVSQSSVFQMLRSIKVFEETYRPDDLAALRYHLAERLGMDLDVSEVVDEPQQAALG